MSNKLIYSLFFLLLQLVGQVNLATAEVPMADQMRAEGKIYVVVAVLLLILFGLIAYLIRLDRKLSRIERNSK
jgi:heme/copper-type cytochrome/quinol oxidase subunit 2